MSALDPLGLAVSKLAVQPGDTVLVRLLKPQSEAAIQQLADRLCQVLPDGVSSLVLCPELTLETLAQVPAALLEELRERCQAELARRRRQRP